MSVAQNGQICFQGAACPPFSPKGSNVVLRLALFSWKLRAQFYFLNYFIIKCMTIDVIVWSTRLEKLTDDVDN